MLVQRVREREQPGAALHHELRAHLLPLSAHTCGPALQPASSCSCSQITLPQKLLYPTLVSLVLSSVLTRHAPLALLLLLLVLLLLVPTPLLRVFCEQLLAFELLRGRLRRLQLHAGGGGSGGGSGGSDRKISGRQLNAAVMLLMMASMHCLLYAGSAASWNMYYFNIYWQFVRDVTALTNLILTGNWFPFGEVYSCVSAVALFGRY